MEVAKINVERRQLTGTKLVRKLRDTGKLPMILYGGGEEPIALQADYPDVRRHLEHHLRVYNLLMDGKMQAGYLHDVQWDCLTDEPLHMDFQRIEMDQPLKMNIELVLVGHAAGIAKGGRLVRDIQYLHLACMPASVPEHVEVPVGHMECNDKIFAKDVELPEGCTLEMPADRLIVHLTDSETKATTDTDADTDTD